MDFNNWRYSILRNARELNLSSETPVSITLLGPTILGATARKRITTSYESPKFAQYSDPEELWLNAHNGDLYRLSRLGVWTKVFSFAEAFDETLTNTGGTGGGDMSGLFNGNTATAPIYLSSENPSADNEAVPKKYVDTLIATLVANLPVATPVADVSALQAIDTTTVKDKRLVFVEDITRIYAYDAESVEEANADQTIVLPNSGIGRWKATVKSNLDSGYF